MLNEHELKTVCFSVGFFALGAVALILYQHAKHTGAMVASLNAASMAANTNTATQGAPNAVVGGASRGVMPVANASLAGSPTPGQLAYDGPNNPPDAGMITVGRNYSLN